MYHLKAGVGKISKVNLLNSVMKAVYGLVLMEKEFRAEKLTYPSAKGKCLDLVGQ